MLAIFLALLLAPQPAAGDSLLVPGVRVGPVTAATTRADLERLFPNQPVQDDEIELEEGILQPATYINRGQPSRALAIVWDSKGPGGHPKRIFICQGLRRGTCEWHTPDGISFGTRLNKLEAMNGKPFVVSGFGFGYGGNVLSWEGGRLAALDCGGKLVLTLDGEHSGPAHYAVEMTPEELHAVRGDRPIPSSTPAMQKLDPHVVGILFEFGGRKCE